MVEEERQSRKRRDDGELAEVGASRNAVVADEASPHARALDIVRARGALSDRERQATYDAACSICVLVLLDADPPRPGAIRPLLGFVAGASAESLAVLLEPTPARNAHPIVSALARAGVIEPRIAQRAHLLIDLRDDPG